MLQDGGRIAEDTVVSMFNIRSMTNVQGRAVTGVGGLVDSVRSFGCVELDVEIGMMPDVRNSHHLLSFRLHSPILSPVVILLRCILGLQRGHLCLCGQLDFLAPPPDLLVEELLPWLGHTMGLFRFIANCLGHICPECFSRLIVVDGGDTS